MNEMNTHDVETKLSGVRLRTSPALDARVRALWTGARFQPRWLRPRRIAVAAAAACIAVIGAWWLLSGGDPMRSAYAELTEAVENSRTAAWVHMQGTSMQQELEVWYSFHPFRAWTRSGDVVAGLDSQEGRHVGYDPGTRTVRIDESAEVPSQLQGAADFLELVMKIIELARAQGHGITERQEVEADKARTVFVIKDEKGLESRIAIDPSANRVIRIEVRQADGTADVLNVDYPQTGPTDMYDLGVPRDARVEYVTQPDPDRSASGSSGELPVPEEGTFQWHFDRAIAIVDSREEWPSTPEEVVKAYWQARNAKQYDEMAVLWPGSASWNDKLADEQPVQYVLGTAHKAPEPWPEHYVFVPYASKSHYDRHGSYNLTMRLSDQKSTNGRYYILSGN